VEYGISCKSLERYLLWTVSIRITKMAAYAKWK
jgi:hypothetical protein